MYKIEIVRGDITEQAVDAIVNAANESLLGGGGVDGAIHRAAGPRLLEECRLLGGCPTGEARMTGGYELPAKYVIHTVGPVWRGGNNDESRLLTSCYQESLILALKLKCEAISFPAISCGVYGYPLRRAAETSIQAVIAFMNEHPAPIHVRWVMFDALVYDVWMATIEEIDAA